MSSKLWIGKKMYLVDDEVIEYIEHLEEAVLSAEQTFEECTHGSDPNVDEAYNNIMENRKKRKKEIK